MIGTLLDQRYQVVKPLGQGGFGHTYIAEDTRRPGNPTCVVKHLKPATSDPEFLQTARRLFNSEAETLEKLGTHDQIPRLLAYFEENQEFYLVQEFIEGHPLSSELPPGARWNESQVIQLLSEVLPILEFVHGNGVIHRDLKPDNLIRRPDNKLVLVDFGAVKQVQVHSLLSPVNNETVAIGTPGYMPSEQGQGRPRPSSDIYALGMIGIQALTGLSPTQLAEDPVSGEIIWRDQTQVRDLLAVVLSQMVRHYFKYRYQSATEAMRSLQPLTKPYTPQALAAMVNDMGRYYLRDGYKNAISALHKLQRPSTPVIPLQNASTPEGDVPAVPLTQNTVTIAVTPSAPPPTNSHTKPDVSISISRRKLPLLIGAGAASVVIAIASISAIRQPPPAATTQNTSAIVDKNNQKNSCVVVISSSNLRSVSGRSRTGKVVKAGTKVTVTGKQEGGWIEISAPESGWIWKSRTKNTCAAK